MDRREWPSELWMARFEDEPAYYISVGDTPRQPDDRRYVLAEWIFCDDRLPESLDYVLCLTDVWIDEDGERFCDVGWYDTDDGEWHICEMSNASIVAWMPLPLPPTAEQIAAYRTRMEGAP